LGCRADEPSRAATVKKLAQELGDSTVTGDYANVIDHTYDSFVKVMGGRENAIKVTESAMEKMKAQGVALKTFEVGDPGEFLAEGSNTFVVVPTTIEMAIPGGKMLSKSYLLGISPDEGKTWKFVDGRGITKHKEALDKFLPKLPAGLKLPDEKQPEIVKDK
jgi:hypothetical protein